MAVSAQEYVAQLKKLLPPGPAFPRGDSETMLAMLLEVFAQELARADARIGALIEEADPRFCLETFLEWLEEWGLPDECASQWQNLTNDTLRELLLWKITGNGSPTIGFFVDLAAMFGYDICIDEFRRFRVTSHVTDVLADERWPHTWRVNVLNSSGSAVKWHKVTGGAEEPLAWWGDNLIECLIRKYAPAHTTVLFGYLEV